MRERGESVLAGAARNRARSSGAECVPQLVAARDVERLQRPLHQVRGRVREDTRPDVADLEVDGERRDRRVGRVDDAAETCAGAALRARLLLQPADQVLVDPPVTLRRLLAEPDRLRRGRPVKNVADEHLVRSGKTRLRARRVRLVGELLRSVDRRLLLAEHLPHMRVDLFGRLAGDPDQDVAAAATDVAARLDRAPADRVRVHEPSHLPQMPRSRPGDVLRAQTLRERATRVRLLVDRRPRLADHARPGRRRSLRESRFSLTRSDTKPRPGSCLFAADEAGRLHAPRRCRLELLEPVLRDRQGCTDPVGAHIPRGTDDVAGGGDDARPLAPNHPRAGRLSVTDQTTDPCHLAPQRLDLVGRLAAQIVDPVGELVRLAAQLVEAGDVRLLTRLARVRTERLLRRRAATNDPVQGWARCPYGLARRSRRSATRCGSRP
jgi:hypothetical protein